MSLPCLISSSSSFSCTSFGTSPSLPSLSFPPLSSPLLFLVKIYTNPESLDEVPTCLYFWLVLPFGSNEKLMKLTWLEKIEFWRQKSLRKCLNQVRCLQFPQRTLIWSWKSQGNTYFSVIWYLHVSSRWLT